MGMFQLLSQFFITQNDHVRRYPNWSNRYRYIVYINLVKFTFLFQISVQEWFYIDFSWSESTGLEVYIDNALVASSTVAITRVRTSVSINTEIYIGKSVTASLSVERTTVLIEDFSIYSVIRTELVKAGLMIEGERL